MATPRVIVIHSPSTRDGAGLSSEIPSLRTANGTCVLPGRALRTELARQRGHMGSNSGHTDSPRSGQFFSRSGRQPQDPGPPAQSSSAHRPNIGSVGVGRLGVIERTNGRPRIAALTRRLRPTRHSLHVTPLDDSFAATAIDEKSVEAPSAKASPFILRRSVEMGTVPSRRFRIFADAMHLIRLEILERGDFSRRPGDRDLVHVVDWAQAERHGKLDR
jgi:hypothetical protein